MGLFEKLRNEFIDIIEWQDSTTDTIVWHFPRYDNEIKMGAKLTVRESQVAVFMNEGKIADIYQPGMYTLETQNMPLMSTLRGWKYGFNSPFKADIYFVSAKQFIDQKWGTMNSITLDDQRFGMIEIRAFGTYAFRISDPGKFIKEIAGTSDNFSSGQVTDQLRSMIVSKFSETAARGDIPIEKFASRLDEISHLGQDKLNSDFAEYGLIITKFLVENVSMPEDLKKEIFEYSRLNKIDINALTRMNAAKAIEEAASNQGGTAGLGAGLGAGMGVASMMTSSFNASANTQGAQPDTTAPPPVPSSFYIIINGQSSGPFDIRKLTQLVTERTLNKDTLAWKKGMNNWIAASEIPEILSLLDEPPPPPPPPPPATT